MKDPYNYKRRMEVVIKNIKRSSSISKKNKEAIIKFRNEMITQGLCLGTVVKRLYSLKRLAELHENAFEKMKKEDVKNLIRKLEEQDLSHSTKRKSKRTFKRFFKWLKSREDYPEEVSWIEAKTGNKRIKLPNELLTEKDIEKLIKAANHPRDQALVSVLYESGCRISELLSLKLKNIEFNKHGAKILVDGKTGQRKVMLVSSAPYLKEWLNHHPEGGESESFLWLRKDDKEEPIGRAAAKSVLKTLKKRSGVKKRVNPHNFRHSRATKLSNHLTEAQMCEYFGWAQGSDMPSVYVHLSGRDVDNAILKTYGIEDTENDNQKSRLKPKECPRCNEVNEATSQWCKRCGSPLDEQAAAKAIKKDLERKEADELLDKLIQDEEFKEVLLEKLAEARTRGNEADG